MCCTRLAEIQDAKNREKFVIWAPSHNFVACIFTTKACVDNRKNLLNSNVSSTCTYNMVNFGPLMAEIGLPVRGTPANFKGLCVLASLLHRRNSAEANQTLHDVWPSPGLVHHIYIFRGSSPTERGNGTRHVSAHFPLARSPISATAKLLLFH